MWLLRQLPAPLSASRLPAPRAHLPAAQRLPRLAGRPSPQAGRPAAAPCPSRRHTAPPAHQRSTFRHPRRQAPCLVPMWTLCPGSPCQGWLTWRQCHSAGDPRPLLHYPPENRHCNAHADSAHQHVANTESAAAVQCKRDQSCMLACEDGRDMACSRHTRLPGKGGRGSATDL